MKNLWLFLVRYNAIFWFILFFTTSIAFVVRNNNFQRASFINSSNILVGSFYQNINSWKGYLSLDDANKKLADENVILRQQIQNILQTDITADSVYISDSIE